MNAEGMQFLTAPASVLEIITDGFRRKYEK